MHVKNNGVSKHRLANKKSLQRATTLDGEAVSKLASKC